MISNKFVLGLSVGICTGAMAGRLVSQKSGTDTRKAIRNRAADLKNRTAELIYKRKSIR